MNERIKLLAVEAGAVYSNDHAVSLLDDEIEKFAELIIDECLRMCDCAEVSLLEHSYPREADGASSVKIFIKEHFGIEE